MTMLEIFGAKKKKEEGEEGEEGEEDDENNSTSFFNKNVFIVVIGLGVLIVLVILALKYYKVINFGESDVDKKIVSDSNTEKIVYPIRINLRGHDGVTFRILDLQNNIIVNETEVPSKKALKDIIFDTSESSIILHRTDTIKNKILEINKILKNNIELPKNEIKSVIRGDLHLFDPKLNDNDRLIRQNNVKTGQLKWGDKLYQIDLN